MIYNHEAGRWEPENEEEAEEYAAYMQETMGGHLLSDDDLREIEERWNKALAEREEARHSQPFGNPENFETAGETAERKDP